MVKAFDSKSNGIFPRRFESYSQRLVVLQLPDLHLCEKVKNVHCRGIEPRSPAWQARILPLNQQCVASLLNQYGVTLRSFFIHEKKILHCRGIEPRSPAWQARILPLNQQCLRTGLFKSGVINSNSYKFPKNWPRWGSNPQSSDSKSDALSIGPRGRCIFVNILGLSMTTCWKIQHHYNTRSCFHV